MTLVWIKRVWRCVEPDCGQRTWTEISEHIRARASMSERARREACRRVGQDGDTVAKVATQCGVGYGRPLIDAAQRAA